MSVQRVSCRWCGALGPDVSGPVHKYVPSAPGCWQIFGQLQADESLRFGYPPVHRLVVDAYMAQHPGDGSDRRDRQSVFVHLADRRADKPVTVSSNGAFAFDGFAIRRDTSFYVVAQRLRSAPVQAQMVESVVLSARAGHRYVAAKVTVRPRAAGAKVTFYELVPGAGYSISPGSQSTTEVPVGSATTRKSGIATARLVVPGRPASLVAAVGPTAGAAGGESQPVTVRPAEIPTPARQRTRLRRNPPRPTILPDCNELRHCADRRSKRPSRKPR
jgi:hypothetical protein